MKLITLENLKSFWKDVKSYVDNGLSKKADSVHGTHVTYGTINGKAPGTPSAGTSSKVAREDHVHPVQTTVSGNAGSATKLATPRTINGTNFDGTANITTANWGTARTLTIGKTGKSVNGSGNVSWTLDEIGAAAVSHAQDFAGTNSNTYIAYPKDGRYRGTPDNASVTGYLKITLPQSWTSSMMKFDVDVFNYADNETMTYTISGYNYSSGANSAWHSATAACKTHQSNPKRNLSVRFGHDGTKCAIYIGEASTTWAYPQVTVKNITVGYSNYALTSWNAGWVVGYTTTLGTISRTVTNPYVGNGGMASTANTLATARTINGTSFNGSGNITTANWGTARTLTIGNSAKSVNGSGNVSWSLSGIGALPLTGGTLSGRLTANGRISAPTAGSSWISGMTVTNATIGISTQQATGSYHPVLAVKTSGNHVANIGGIGDDFGFYGFKSGRTENGTDWSFKINAGTGAVSSTGNITAPTFVGALSGNASTATKATQDSAGQQINKTYIKGLSVSGKTITYTKGDGTTGTITTQDTNTTYSTGTSSALGLTKLYTGTGTATDGTMTQSAIKTALDGKAASSHTHSYLPLSGGTLSGDLTISRTTGDSKFHARRTDTNTGVWVGVGGNGVDHGLFSTRHNKWIVHANSNQVAINEFVVGSTAAQRFNSIPVINHAGVMEMGWTIDFHKTNTNGTDYNARLQISDDETFTFTNGLYPAGQDRFELGNANRRWRSAYFSGNVNAKAHVNNSERELKDNIQVFDSNEAYETVKKLNVYTYNYKERLDSELEIKMDDDGNVIPRKGNKKKPKVNTYTHMGIIVDEAPKEIVSEDGTGIDIYGFTSYTASALKIAIKKIEKLEKLLNVT